MSSEQSEKYLLAGVDDRQRGFSRQVEIEPVGQQYRASIQYEKLSVATEHQASNEAALLQLVHDLQRRGYRQLRSKLSFRGKDYCPGIESWTEYPDPAPVERRRLGLLGTLRVMWRRLLP